MEMLTQFVPMVSRFVVFLVMLGLAIGLRGLRARGWLIGFVAIEFAASILVTMMNALRAAEVIGWETYQRIMMPLNPALAMSWAVGLATLLIFVFSQRTGVGSGVGMGRILFSFRGRIPRHQFWIGAVVLAPIGWIVAAHLFAAIDGVSHSSYDRFSGNAKANLAGAIFVYVVWLIPAVWMSLALQIKRWHDLGKSGVWVLIALIPIVGPIWALVETGCFAGTAGRNVYGEDVLNPQGPPPPPGFPAQVSSTV